MNIYNLPIYAIKETIGKPELFTGRRNELDFLLKWASGIEEERSESIVLLGRKKSGKTAIIDRLYNILYAQQGNVIPLFYKMESRKKWLPYLAKDIFIN